MHSPGHRKGYWASMLAVVGAVFSAAAVQAASIAPDLAAELAARAPQDEVAVIVTLSERVNRHQFKLTDRSKRNTRLVKALKEKAAATQPAHRVFLLNKGARQLRELWAINGIAVTARASVIRQLASRPGIDSIRLDSTLQAPETTYGSAAPPEWNLNVVRAPELWSLGYTGSGVVVANMDTGVDVNHPDLAAKWRGGDNSWYDPHGEHTTPYDHYGHGTQTMAIMVGGAAGGTAIGMAPGASWVAVKMFNDAGEATYSDIHLAFQWLLDPDGDLNTVDAPDVVNASWGLVGSAGQCITEFGPDIDLLKTAGIAVAFAAGNDGPAPLTSLSPANNPQGFGVGAIDAAPAIASFSSRGPSACDGTIYPKLVAPGVNINTADLSFGGLPLYAVVSGTSYATPHAAGAMALLAGAFPSVDVAQMEAALIQSAHDLGVAGEDNSYGYGLADVLAAYQLLLAGAGSPPAITSTAVTTATVGQPYSYDVDATDPNAGDVLSYSLDVFPPGMTIDGTSGLIAWTPGAAGDSSVTVRVTDSGGLFSTQSFTITAQPPMGSPPAITSTAVITATVGQPYSYDVNATDPDAGDVLTYSLDVSPPGMTIDGTTGLISWTPGAAGGSNVTVRVTDAGSLSDTQSFIVMAQPAVAPVQLYFSIAGNTAVPGVSGTPDNADVYSWDGASFARVLDATAAGLSAGANVDGLKVMGSQIYLSFSNDVGVSVPGVGLVQDEDIVVYDTGSGSWSLFFDGSAVDLTNGNNEDVDAFDILADGSVLVSTVGNMSVPGLAGTWADEDVLHCVGTFGTTTSCTWSVYFDGSDVALTATSEDVDGISVGSGLYLSTIGAYSVTGLSNATANAGGDVFSCNSPVTGAVSSCASFSLYFRASDHGLVGNLDAISVPLLLVGEGSPPAITSTTVITATVGQPYSYDVNATDPDAGDVLSYSLDVFPAGMTINGATGVISWTPGAAGDSSVTVRATDSSGLFAIQSFTVTAQPAVAPLLYFSTEGNTTVPGVGGTPDNADVYSWDGTSFARVLDATAAGLPAGANVDGLKVMGSQIYLSFSNDVGVSVPGVGLVQDEDIVVYDTGSGSWSLFFDGSAVDLTNGNNEDVDAFDILADGSVLVSTRGAVLVPGLTGTWDEDVLQCVPGSSSPIASCTWSVYFDGSDIGLTLAAEDVDGFKVGDGELYLSLFGAYSLSGGFANATADAGGDVFSCDTPVTGAVTSCGSFTLYFRASDHGLTGNLDAISVP